MWIGTIGSKDTSAGLFYFQLGEAGNYSAQNSFPCTLRGPAGQERNSCERNSPWVRQQLCLLFGGLCCQKLSWLVGSRLSLLFSWHPVLFPDCWPCWWTVAPDWLPNAQLQIPRVNGLPETSKRIRIPFCMLTTVSQICSPLLTHPSSWGLVCRSDSNPCQGFTSPAFPTAV